MRDRRPPGALPDFSLEAALWAEGFRRVAGVDEAGRGPLAGPVVTAAVILPREWPVDIALDDSKRMTPAARERAFGEIRKRAIAYRIAVVSHETIDRINILQATLAGMARAVAGLKLAPDCVLVDGNRAPDTAAQSRTLQCRTVVGGDGKSLSIAAASVLAKVVRDRLMRVYDRRYPGWGFAVHKGYPTAAHREAVARLGASPIHRLTFGALARAGTAGGKPWPETAGIESTAALTARMPGGSARSMQPGFWSEADTRSGSATGAVPPERST
jgi:ribonuclease HII